MIDCWVAKAVAESDPIASSSNILVTVAPPVPLNEFNVFVPVNVWAPDKWAVSASSLALGITPPTQTPLLSMVAVEPMVSVPARVVTEAAPLAIVTSTSAAVALEPSMVIPFLKVPSLATVKASLPASSLLSASDTCPVIRAKTVWVWAASSLTNLIKPIVSLSAPAAPLSLVNWSILPLLSEWVFFNSKKGFWETEEDITKLSVSTETSLPVAEIVKSPEAVERQQYKQLL